MQCWVFFLLVLRTRVQKPCCMDFHFALPLHQLLRCTMLDCRLCSNVYFVVGFWFFWYTVVAFICKILL